MKGKKGEWYHPFSLFHFFLLQLRSPNHLSITHPLEGGLERQERRVVSWKWYRPFWGNPDGQLPLCLHPSFYLSNFLFFSSILFSISLLFPFSFFLLSIFLLLKFVSFFLFPSFSFSIYCLNFAPLAIRASSNFGCAPFMELFILGIICKLKATRRKWVNNSSLKHFINVPNGKTSKYFQLQNVENFIMFESSLHLQWSHIIGWWKNPHQGAERTVIVLCVHTCFSFMRTHIF